MVFVCKHQKLTPNLSNFKKEDYEFLFHIFEKTNTNLL
jgi:hypothetical protein